MPGLRPVEAMDSFEADLPEPQRHPETLGALWRRFSKASCSRILGTYLETTRAWMTDAGESQRCVPGEGKGAMLIGECLLRVYT